MQIYAANDLKRVHGGQPNLSFVERWRAPNLTKQTDDRLNLASSPRTMVQHQRTRPER